MEFFTLTDNCSSVLYANNISRILDDPWENVGLSIFGIDFALSLIMNCFILFIIGRYKEMHHISLNLYVLNAMLGNTFGSVVELSVKVVTTPLNKCSRTYDSLSTFFHFYSSYSTVILLIEAWRYLLRGPRRTVEGALAIGVKPRVLRRTFLLLFLYIICIIGLSLLMANFVPLNQALFVCPGYTIGYLVLWLSVFVVVHSHIPIFVTIVASIYMAWFYTRKQRVTPRFMNVVMQQRVRSMKIAIALSCIHIVAILPYSVANNYELSIFVSGYHGSGVTPNWCASDVPNVTKRFESADWLFKLHFIGDLFLTTYPLLFAVVLLTRSRLYRHMLTQLSPHRSFKDQIIYALRPDSQCPNEVTTIPGMEYDIHRGFQIGELGGNVPSSHRLPYSKSSND